MLYGMFSYEDNCRRMDALDRSIALAERRGRHEEADELRADREELLAWFRDVARIDP